MHFMLQGVFMQLQYADNRKHLGLTVIQIPVEMFLVFSSANTHSVTVGQFQSIADQDTIDT